RSFNWPQPPSLFCRARNWSIAVCRAGPFSPSLTLTSSLSAAACVVSLAGVFASQAVAFSRDWRAGDVSLGAAGGRGPGARQASRVATSSDSKTGGGRFFGGAEDQAQAPSDS